MNHYVEVFLRETLGQVRYQKMHPTLAQELNDHIESLKEEMMDGGMAEEVAYKKAVEAMGEPRFIGKQLHALHRPKCDWLVIGLIATLIGIGLVAFGMRGHEGEMRYYVGRQMTFACVGMMLFYTMYHIDYQKLERYSWGFYGVGVALIIYTLCFGVTVNGASRWIRLPGLNLAIESFQLAMPLFIVGFVGLVRSWANKGIKGYAILAAVGGSATLLCLVSHTMSGVYLGGVLIGSFVCYTLGRTFTGDRKRVYLGLVGIMILGIGGCLAFITSKAYMLARFKVWLKPELDPYGMGYQPLAMREVLNNAGLFGTESIDNIMYLVDTATDYSFTFIIGRMGWVVAGAIVVVIGVMLARCLHIAFHTKESYGRLLMFSMSLLFLIQFIIGLFTNVGLLPMTSCTIPFLSYGGSKLVCDLAMMGFLLGIYRRKDIIPDALVH